MSRPAQVRLPRPSRRRLAAGLALLLGALAIAGCTRGWTPSPVTFTGNEVRVAEFFLETPGTYEITSQVITAGLANFELVEPSTSPCPGAFTVNKNEAKACHAKVKGFSYAPGETGTLSTWWRPSGAKFSRKVETHLKM